MKFRMLGIVAMSMFIVGCTEEKKDDPSVESQIGETSGEETSTGYVQGEKGNSQSTSNNDTFKDFQFYKDVPVVRITEGNNSALVSRPSGGIATTKAFYVSDDKMLYFLYNSEMPTESTELIVIDERNNDSYMLAQNVHISEGPHESTIEEINNEYVDNSGRLFLGKSLSITPGESGSVQISAAGESFTLEKGDTKEIVLNSGETESTLTFENYGILNTSTHMKYQELEDAVIVDDENLNEKTIEEFDIKDLEEENEDLENKKSETLGDKKEEKVSSKEKKNEDN